jgi:hypothetical protein
VRSEDRAPDDCGTSVGAALEIALGLPGAERRDYSAERVGFSVRGKGFAYVNLGGWASIKTVPAEEAALRVEDPVAFQPTGNTNWVAVQLSAVGIDRYTRLITRAWRLAAPKRMVALLPSQSQPTVYIGQPAGEVAGDQ